MADDPDTDAGTDTEAAEAIDDTVDEAAEVLYAADPAEFLARRDELVKQAKERGAAAAAKRIKALRKPTVAASLVNRLVLRDPSSVVQISDLGARMQAAQEALDAGVLRELTTERRALVGRLAAAAVALPGRGDPSGAVRDEITSTFDAAVADRDVAQRLGRLARSESWSGFGFDAGSAPELTLLHGGGAHERGARARREPTAAPEQPAKPPPAQRRRLARALDKARSVFETADDALTSAESEEQADADRVRALSADLVRIQQELDEAKRSLTHARRDTKSARARRREARSALDRAQRQAD